MSRKPTSSPTPRRAAARKRALLTFDNVKATTLAEELQTYPKDPERIRAFYVALKPMVDKALQTKFAKDLDHPTRDDLSQDILLKLMAKIGQFKSSKAPLFNWVSTVIHNTVLDYRKKYRKEVRLSHVTPGSSTATVDGWVEADADTLSEMRAFFPFYVSSETFYDLFSAVEQHNFKASNNLATAIGKVLKARKINYAKYGSLLEYAQFMVVLYRAWMVKDDPELYQRVGEASRNYDAVNPVRVLGHYLQPKQLALVLHLLGGVPVKLPTPGKIVTKHEKDQAR